MTLRILNPDGRIDGRRKRKGQSADCPNLGPSQQRYMTRHEVGFDRCDQGKPRWVPLANCSARRLMNRRTHKRAPCFDGSTHAAISIPWQKGKNSAGADCKIGASKPPGGLQGRPHVAPCTFVAMDPIISVGRGKDGSEKVEAMTIEPTTAFRTARKFVREYCVDCPPPKFDGDPASAIEGAAARIVEANITDTDLELAKAGNRDAKLKIEEAIWPVKRRVK